MLYQFLIIAYLFTFNTKMLKSPPPPASVTDTLFLALTVAVGASWLVYLFCCTLFVSEVRFRVLSGIYMLFSYSFRNILFSD